MGRTNRGCELQILTDRQMLVERVLLRNVADVFFEIVHVRIKRTPIQKNLPARRLKLSGEHSEQRAFARTARTHHAHQLPTRQCK